MVGEAAPFTWLFYEGEKTNIYLLQAGEGFILAVIFDPEVTWSLVRIYTKKAIEDMDKLFSTYQEHI